MNRREMLTGVVAVAIAASVPAVEATATWRRISDFTLDGDFTIEMWLRPCEDRRPESEQLRDGMFHGYVDELSVRADSEEGRQRLMIAGLSSDDDDISGVVDVLVSRYKRYVPKNGEWHHLYAHRGVVLVDGLLVDKPDGVALTIDGTGDYVAVS